MIRLSSTLWLLLVSGCTTAAQHPEVPPSPDALLPAFEDQPLGPDEEVLDGIITVLAERVLAGDLGDVSRTIKSRASGRLRLAPVTYTFGDVSDQPYVMSDQSGSYRSDWDRENREDLLLDERLDHYVHFAIKEPRMRLFVPTICRESARWSGFPRLDVLRSDEYFDMICDGRVRLKLFMNDSSDPTPFLTQVVIYAEPQ